jgi:hypothetical protein
MKTGTANSGPIYQMVGVPSWLEGIERTGTLKADGSDIDCDLANASRRRR